MKLLALAVVFALVGTILAKDMAKDDQVTKQTADERKTLRVHHLTVEEKNKMIQRKKEFMDAHPDMKARDKGGRKRLQNTKERIMEIKNSDLPKEEKKAKLINLKKELADYKMDARDARAGRRGRPTPEERRAMIARRKGAFEKDATYGDRRQSRIMEKAMGKVRGEKPRPGLLSKRGDIKKMEDQ